MSEAATNRMTFASLLHLELLPLLSFHRYFDPGQMSAAREVNAAVVNVSGRQRMLSQRTAFLSLRLVCASDATERESLRQQLLDAIQLMEQSHHGLIYGDASLNLPGQPSKVVQSMYFDLPLQLDQQVRCYIAEVKALAQVPNAELTQDNAHLSAIMATASEPLLAALDAVVSQYQRESDVEHLAIDIYQAELYEQSCTTATQAQAQAQQLEQTLYQLQQTQAQLIHSEKMSSLGSLVAGIAHEINNPISFISGNLAHAGNYIQDLLQLVALYQHQYPQENLQIQDCLEAIEFNFLIEDLPKLLASMQFGTERIRQIVLSLRNFARLDEAAMKPVNLHEGIDSTLLILHNRLGFSSEHPDIQIIKNYGDLPLVECYAGQINQVFMNILSNAIDALHSNEKQGSQQVTLIKPQITISTEALDSSHAVVRIIDNGPGIPEQIQAHLFDPFFTTKPVGQGTGLGLFISHQIIVEKHGGTLTCVSHPGQGAEFIMQIPLFQDRCTLPSKPELHRSYYDLAPIKSS